MFPVKYIVRLDDACPTMHRDRWLQIENILDRHNVKPIVAVVPDNRDSDLILNDIDATFWNRVRAWQERGWTVAMHGLSHVLHNTTADQIVPFHARSEFSGLPYQTQVEKISKAKAIFDAEDVRVGAWVAPAHGFDRATLKALKSVTDIDVISDGIALHPFYEQDFFWLPQQLWRFRAMPFGLWTVCLHPNSMGNQAMDAFERDVSAYAEHIVDVSSIIFTQRRRRFIDRLAGAAYWLMRGKVRAAFR